jgi:hypothetical protein
MTQLNVSLHCTSGSEISRKRHSAVGTTPETPVTLTNTPAWKTLLKTWNDVTLCGADMFVRFTMKRVVSADPVALQRCDQFVGCTTNWLYDHLRFVGDIPPLCYATPWPTVTSFSCLRPGASIVWVSRAAFGVALRQIACIQTTCGA